jgi:hypothetical protein
MKEDSQLICPISFHDPSGNIWSSMQQGILDRLPLCDVLCKSTSTISLSQAVAVARLPLRFMPSTASLFKDTDHPFRWFLAPYTNIYFVQVNSMEAYKESKAGIRKWIETVVGLKRSSWLLVYAPQPVSGSVSLDSTACSKVFAKICSDFYVEKIGDRSVNFMNISLSAAVVSSSPISSPSSNNASDSNSQYNLLVGKLDRQIEKVYEEFFSRIKEGIVYSFYQRCVFDIYSICMCVAYMYTYMYIHIYIHIYLSFISCNF